MEEILLGLLSLGAGAYVAVCPERAWKLLLYPRSLRWPDREPTAPELFMTRMSGGGLVLLGLLLCFGYL